MAQETYIGVKTNTGVTPKKATEAYIGRPGMSATEYRGGDIVNEGEPYIFYDCIYPAIEIADSRGIRDVYIYCRMNLCAGDTYGLGAQLDGTLTITATDVVGRIHVQKISRSISTSVETGETSASGFMAWGAELPGNGYLELNGKEYPWADIEKLEFQFIAELSNNSTGEENTEKTEVDYYIRRETGDVVPKKVKEIYIGNADGTPKLCFKEGQ